MGDIVIANAQPGTLVQIYNLSGMRVANVVSVGDEMRAALPQGLYIVRVGAKAYKIRN